MAADPAAGALAGGEEAGAPPPDELHFNPETGEVFRRLSSGEYELVPDVILSPEEGEAALTEQEGLTVDAVPALLEMLNAEERADQEDALGLLCELVGGAFGDDGAVVGEAMRQGGAPLTLSYLLADESGNVRMQALYLMSNLASDAVDPNSAATKQALLQCGLASRRRRTARRPPSARPRSAHASSPRNVSVRDRSPTSDGRAARAAAAVAAVAARGRR